MELSLLSRDCTLRRLGPEDIPTVLTLCSGNPQYYRYHPPLPTAEGIREDLSSLPPGKGPEDKYYFGFFRQGRLCAVMDLILGYPQPQTAFFGFFMVDHALQGQGFGRCAIGQCLAALKAQGFTRARLAVDEGNPQSLRFWQRCGFSLTGQRSSGPVSVYLPMERSL